LEAAIEAAKKKSRIYHCRKAVDFKRELANEESDVFTLFALSDDDIAEDI